MTFAPISGPCPVCHAEHVPLKPADANDSAVYQKIANNFAQDEIADLREQVEKLTKERDDLLGYKKYWKEWLNLQSGDARQIAERAEYADALEQQLAAIAEQNETLRAAITDNWIAIESTMTQIRIGQFANALDLPNLATPVMNRIRAEGMREGAIVCDEAVAKWEGPWKNAANTLGGAIRARAAELEKANA